MPQQTKLKLVLSANKLHTPHLCLPAHHIRHSLLLKQPVFHSGTGVKHRTLKRTVLSCPWHCSESCTHLHTKHNQGTGLCKRAYPENPATGLTVVVQHAPGLRHIVAASLTSQMRPHSSLPFQIVEHGKVWKTWNTGREVAVVER